jgi:hypothetical protein
LRIERERGGISWLARKSKRAPELRLRTFCS